MNEIIINYIKEALGNGIPEETIRQNLKTVGGYSDPEIEEAFKAAVLTPNPAQQPPPPPQIDKKETTVATPPPTPAPAPTYTSAPAPPPKSSKRIGLLLMTILVLLGSGFVYAYIQKIGPFSLSKYSEEKFLSDLLVKISQIKSSSYIMSGTLGIDSRDQGAKLFTLEEPSNAAELRMQYKNDYQRLKDVNSIISRLNDYSNYHKSSSKVVTFKPYPASFKTAYNAASSDYYYMSNSIIDPVTKKEYEYKIVDKGSNFLLTVYFETDYAIKAITESYQYSDTHTIIEGNKVSFTKDSYAYMSSELPKPLIVEMSESLKMLPPDINISTAISASSELKTGEIGNWQFNISAEGDFGDLTYKVNIDALRKDDYYFKISNFPSIFLFGDLSSIKGKWIKISSEKSSSTDQGMNSSLSYLRDEFPKMEESYKEKSGKFFQLVKRAITIADGEKLIAFKEKPREEKVDGRQLVRYELTLRKEAILPFYTKLQEEINSNPDFSEFKEMIDQGLIDYLKSDEFEQVFDYLNSNNAFVLWTDDKGFPAIAQNTMRIIPPDTALQLKDKQINIIFKMTISNINKNVGIQAPSDSVPIEEILAPPLTVIDSARAKARDARRQSDLRQFLSAQEMYYGDYGKYYLSASQKGLPAVPTYLLTAYRDPLCPNGTCETGAIDYSWQNNNIALRCKNTASNKAVGEWFCAYGKLENKGTCSNIAYYAASQQGSKTVCDAAPTITGDCSCF